MRLIDADEVEKQLRAYADDVGCNRGEYELANGILKAVCFIRSNVKTAYDVDKVVGQLDKKLHNYYPSIDHYCLSEKVIRRSDAIEIVKAGGVNE